METAFKSLTFPFAGLDVTGPYCKQMPRPMPGGEYGRTTRLCQNVRAFDTGDRRRGGQRPGLEKYVAARAVADWLVQHLQVVVGAGYAPPGSTMQSSQSGRVVSLVQVNQGNVYVLSPGQTTWTSATNNTGRSPPLAYSGIMASAVLNQKVWFADGCNWTYYDPATNQVENWTASAGSLPGTSCGQAPRLIVAWRGRLVLSGLADNPQNLYATKIGQPTDFNYFPDTSTPDMAWASNSAPMGQVGDMVTCLIPIGDDKLIVGCDHELWTIQGDPTAGGRADQISKTVGMAWGQPWEQDPQGNVYFLSNHAGIYVMEPGGRPVRISQPIDSILAAYNTGTMTVRMLWDDFWQGLHIFFTFTNAPAVSTHWFWDQRTGGWFPQQYADTDFNPLTCVKFDGNLPADRVGLIGSWDGYVRSVSGTATTDDGKAIDSRVVLGPFTTKDMDEFMFKGMQATLAEEEDGDGVSYGVYSGATAERALNDDAVSEGEWAPGRNPYSMVRRRGHAFYVDLQASNWWALEEIRAETEAKGKVARRSF